jgi:uncharacterized membrane protein YgaE (UPF0421/DUF939 family)
MRDMKAMNRKFFVSMKNKALYFYMLKCIIGASISYIFYILFPTHQFYWAIISVLLVLAPDDRDSIKLAYDRIKANMTGALIGLFFFLVMDANLISICLAVVSTIIVCTYFELGGATRSSLAALIIVLIQEKEKNDWQIASERMVSVVIGCLIGLVLTYTFLYLRKKGFEKGAGK